MSPSETLTLVERYRRGDEEAARLLFDRYVQQLLKLASSNLPPGLARRFGPEDVVQSVFRSLFSAVKANRVTLERSGDLWAWLLQVTFNKLRSRVAYHRAGKRSIDREQELPVKDRSWDHHALDPLSKEPSVEDLLALADELDHLFGPTGSPLRSVVDLRLQDLSMEKIGERLGISHTTVSRRLKKIERRLEERLCDLSENDPLAGDSIA